MTNTAELNREPVGQTINSIIRQLNEIARLLHDPATYDEVAAEETALWTAKNQIEWILSYIREKKDEPFMLTVVQ